MAAAKCRTILQIIYEHSLYSTWYENLHERYYYFRDVLWVKIRLLMLDLLSN